MNTPPNGKTENKKNSELNFSYINNRNTVPQKSCKRVLNNKSDNKIEKNNNENIMFQPTNSNNYHFNEQNIKKKKYIL